MPKGLAINTVHYNEPHRKTMSVAKPDEEFETTVEQLAYLVRVGAARALDDDGKVTAAPAPRAKTGRPTKKDAAEKDAAEKDAADKAAADAAEKDAAEKDAADKAAADAAEKDAADKAAADAAEKDAADAAEKAGKTGDVLG